MSHVLKVDEVENYVHVPKSINRRDKSKISDILFRKTKKVKWKKVDDCDCSRKYLVTINEYGKVSKVTMLGYETEEKIDQYWEREQYDYCIN